MIEIKNKDIKIIDVLPYYSKTNYYTNTKKFSAEAFGLLFSHEGTEFIVSKVFFSKPKIIMLKLNDRSYERWVRESKSQVELPLPLDMADLSVYITYCFHLDNVVSKEMSTDSFCHPYEEFLLFTGTLI